MSDYYNRGDVEFNYFAKLTAITQYFPSFTLDDKTEKESLGNAYRVCALPLIVAVFRLGHTDRKKISVDFYEKVLQMESSDKSPLLFKQGLNMNVVIDLANKYAVFSDSVNLLFSWKDEKITFVGAVTGNTLEGDNYREFFEDVELSDLVKSKIPENQLCLVVGNKVYGLTYYNRYKIFYKWFKLWFAKNFEVLVPDAKDKSSLISLQAMALLYHLFLKTLGIKEDCPSFSNDVLLTVDAALVDIYPPYALGEESLTSFLEPLLVDTDDAEDKDDDTFFIPEKYSDNTLVNLEIDKKLNDHVDASWLCFYHNKEKFLAGCEIILAENEIIFNSKDEPILFQADVKSLFYRGPEFINKEKRNSVFLLSITHIDAVRLKALIEFFTDELNLSFRYTLVGGGMDVEKIVSPKEEGKKK